MSAAAETKKRKIKDEEESSEEDEEFVGKKYWIDLAYNPPSVHYHACEQFSKFGIPFPGHTFE